MKKLALAVLLLISVAVATFWLLDTFLHEDFDYTVYERGLPRALTGFLLIFTPFVHQLLSGRRARFSLSGLPDGIVPFADYALPGYVLLVYGLLFVYAASGLALVVIWLAGQITGLFITSLIAPLRFVVLAAAFFAVGGWIGRRAQRRPSRVAAPIVGGYAALTALDTWLAGTTFIALTFVVSTLVYLLITLAGVRQGRGRRLMGYVQYLLSFVLPEERPVVTDAIYREVAARSPVAEQPAGTPMAVKRREPMLRS